MTGTETRQMSVKLNGDDQAALAVVREHVQQTAGMGLRVNDADAARWAIHTCAALIVQQEDAGAQ